MRIALELILLAAVWGASYIFIRVGAPAFGSAWLIALRVLLAGAALWLALTVFGRRPRFRHAWWQYALLGIINAALPFTLITNAVGGLNASTASILNAMTPISTAIVASVWLRDPLTARKLGGLVLGLAGVVTLVGWNPLPINAVTISSAAQSLLATVCYGIGACYTRINFADDAPPSLAVAQQLGASAPQFLLAAFTPLPRPDVDATLSLIALALLCTSFAYVLYFRLVATLGPTRGLTTIFLVPFFSVLWGVVFLNEPLYPAMFAALAMILAAVALVAFKPAAKAPAVQPAAPASAPPR